MDQFGSDTGNKLHILYKLELDHLEHEDTQTSSTTKRKIREVLTSIINGYKLHLNGVGTGNDLIWGFCMTKLANNLSDESKDEAQTHLQEVVHYFELNKNVSSISGVLQFAYNSLGIVTNVNCESTVCSTMDWLKKAEDIYQVYRRNCEESNGPPCLESLSNFCATSDSERLLRFILFEHGYITTLFLFAQTYSSISEKQKAAEFCRKTLIKQLELAPHIDKFLKSYNGSEVQMRWLKQNLSIFDPNDWALNAATLNEYFTEINHFSSALECLLTAKSVLKSNSIEDLNGTKTWADVARLTLQYSLKLLKQGSEVISGFESAANANEAATSNEYGTLFNQDTESALEEAYGETIDKVDISKVISALTTPPKVYSEAARLFRWTCKSISDALLYYKLNDHCSDAVELIRSHACAYGCLADFEENLSRKKRRVDLLENVLNELNPQFYMTDYRNLMMECAAALTTLRDLNEQKLKKTSQSGDSDSLCGISKHVKKVNALSQRAIDIYSRFLDSFLAPASKTSSEFYEECWLGNILIITPGKSRKRLENLLKARENYEMMVEIADRHARNDYKIDVPEVELSKEMIPLLNVQISRFSLDG